MQKRSAKAKMAIITRTKNRNLLLERAIKSVIAQTSKEYVHVVLNDGGDKSEVEALLKKHPDKNRVVLHNKKTAGLTVALNQAIRAVNSTYISILDDDDTWAPQRVEIVNKFMDENKSKGAVVVMDRVIEEISPEGNEVRELSRDRWLEGITTINLYEQCLHNYLSNGSFNYTREVYEELRGYDQTLGVAEDWDFGIRYLLKYDADFINTKDALTYYHHRPTQKGEIGNSVFAGIDEHAKNLNFLRNKYLREDINNGRFGIGYIMNDLAYRQSREAELERKVLEKVVRLEGHVNYAAKRITEDIKRDMVSQNTFQQFKQAIFRKRHA